MALNIGPISASPLPPDNGSPSATTVAASATHHAGTSQATAKTQLNLAIVQASLSVSIDSGNHALTLLFKSAIDKINEVLQPTLGANAIQNAVAQDNTPQGTADRIVSLSTGFFDAYKKQHPEMSQADALSNFMATIRKGFEQGLGDAKNILQGLQVLNGDIASNIDKTSELVQQGYAAFEAEHSATASTPAGTTASDAAA